MKPQAETPDLPVAGRSLFQDGVRRFRSNRFAVLGVAVLLLEALLCGIGLFYATRKIEGSGAVAAARYEWIRPNRSADKNPAKAAPQLPSGGFSGEHPLGLNADGEETHLLGSDGLGRDYLARLLYGGCVSLGIGLASAITAALFGSLYGAVSGYAGGRIDNLMMRVVEILFSLPYMLLVVLMYHLMGGSTGEGAKPLIAMFVAVASFNWMTEARVVRGQVMLLKDMPFIEAARAVGVPAHRILLVHMFPNVLGPIVVMGTLMVPQAILLESFLSFLGIGIQAPMVSWGLMAADAVKTINTVENHWHLLIPPCAALAITLLALNFVGDGLRDAFDPQTRR